MTEIDVSPHIILKSKDDLVKMLLISCYFNIRCTEESLAEDFEHPKFPILKKQGDFEAGCTAFLRSIPYCQEEGSERTVREFPNEITSYIDASNVYGSYQDLLDRLRGENGKQQIENFHS